MSSKLTLKSNASGIYARFLYNRSARFITVVPIETTNPYTCKDWLFLMLWVFCVSFSMLARMRSKLLGIGNEGPHCGDLKPFLCELTPRLTVAVMPAAVKLTTIGARRPPEPGAHQGAGGGVAGRGSAGHDVEGPRGRLVGYRIVV